MENLNSELLIEKIRRVSGEKVMSHELVSLLKKILEDLKKKLEEKKKHSKKMSDDEISKAIVGSVESAGQSNFNLYPSEKSVGCKELCVGIAMKSFGAGSTDNATKYGFKGLMLDIIDCWFKCFDINKETLLFTRNWDEKKFDDDWKQILDSYSKAGKSVYVIQFTGNDYLVHYPQ